MAIKITMRVFLASTILGVVMLLYRTLVTQPWDVALLLVSIILSVITGMILFILNEIKAGTV